MATTSQRKQFKRSAAYIQGNLAREIDVRRAINEKPTGRVLNELKGENIKEQRKSVNFVYVLFLAAAVCITVYAMISYISLQAEITNLVNNIGFYEQDLNNKTLANDDEYSKMVNAVDYDEIRRVAIEELGMVYASEDQIVSYTRENSDYVIQLNSLNN